MKRVTKNNMLRYLKMREEYEKTGDKNLLKLINIYIEEVINKDKHYYKKLSSYNFTEDILKKCL